MMLCTGCPHTPSCSGANCFGESASDNLRNHAAAIRASCAESQGITDYTESTDKPPASVAMVVAYIEKSLESFTCLTFATVVEAEKFLTDRLGQPNCNGWWVVNDTVNMRACADDFFLEYYDEYGGIAAFTISTAQHGKPFIAF